LDIGDLGSGARNEQRIGSIRRRDARRFAASGVRGFAVRGLAGSGGGRVIRGNELLGSAAVASDYHLSPNPRTREPASPRM